MLRSGPAQPSHDEKRAAWGRLRGGVEIEIALDQGVGEHLQRSGDSVGHGLVGERSTPFCRLRQR